MNNKKGVKKFLIFSILGLVFINLTFASAYLILTKYGTLTLNPGEDYIVNIPFIGPSNPFTNYPTICGTAEQTNGILLKNVTIIVKGYNNDTVIAQNVTNSDGKYCITLPEIKSSTQKFDVYVQYDNKTISLGSNDYQLNFENNLVYNKGLDNFVYLTGDITNEDAKIENGRFEINLKYQNVTTGDWEDIFDYQKYSVNIESDEIYSVPNNGLNVSWEIPSDAKEGRYKFYIKTSFNAKEHTKDIYFNITE